MVQWTRLTDAVPRFTTPALLGGCVAAIVQLTAQTYLRTDPVLVKANQPDVLNLHIEFLRVSTHDDSTIKVVPVKIGGTVSTLQLQLLYAIPHWLYYVFHVLYPM